jgi:O-antigen ligase
MKKFLTALLILSIPLDSNYYLVFRGLYHQGWINGISITFVDILLLFIYLIWFFQEKRGSIIIPNASKPAIGFIIAAMLSALNAPVPKLTFFLVILFFKVFLVFVLIANSVKDRKDLNLVVTLLLIGLGIQSTLCLLQYYTGEMYSVHFLFSDRPKVLLHDYRFQGTFGAVAPLASFLFILVILSIGMLVNPLVKANKKTYGLVSILGIIVLILTLSRGGWIGFAISFVFLIWFLAKAKIFRFNRFFFLILFVCLISMLFADTISSRLKDPASKKSAASRIPLIEMSLRIISDNPIFGTGGNNYYRVIIKKDTDYWKYIVHSQFLLIWAEMGTIGLFFYLWFLASVLRSGIRVSIGNDAFVSTVALSLTAGLIGHAFHALVDLFTGYNFLYFFWCICGLLAGLEQYQANNLRKKLSMIRFAH